MTTIAFIVRDKNEDEVIRFINKTRTLLAAVKVISTKTNKNKIENALDKKNLSILNSVEQKGDLQITSKVLKGGVGAVFYFSPQIDAVSGLIELSTACSKKKSYMALNSDTADCVIQRLAAEKGLQPSFSIKGSAIKPVKNISDQANNRVIPPYDLIAPKPFTPKQLQQTDWSQQQLTFWLTENKLEYLDDIFKDKPTDNDAAKLWTHHETLSNYLQLKGGTPSQLVDLLILSKDSSLAKVFEQGAFIRDWFMTYLSFITPLEFLVLLKDSYSTIYEEYDDPDDISEAAESLVNILNCWIQIDGDCITKDEELSRTFNKFINLLKEKRSTDAVKLRIAMSKKVDGKEKLEEISNQAPPAPMQPKLRNGKLVGLRDVDALELARQMTLMESTLFRKILPREFHKTAWAKSDAKILAPNLTQVIEISNRFSGIIITEILRQNSIERMVELISKFIKVGKHMFYINNYSGVMEIVTALSNSAIQKLKHVWNLIPMKLVNLYNEMEEFVSPIGHYKRYRDEFKSRDETVPCLPLLAATLSDLNGYEEVFANFKDGIVNWTKMAKTGVSIWDNVSIYSNYNFARIETIQKYFENIVWADNLTTCSIADLRMQELTKSVDIKDKDKKSKGKSNDYTVEPQTNSGELSANEWNYLKTGANRVNYMKDQVILACGKPNTQLYRIITGTVRVVKEINGKEEVVSRMSGGQTFGEISMLLRSQKVGATASIIADSEVDLYVIDMDYIYQLWEQQPKLAESLNRILAIKLARWLREMGAVKAPAQQPADGTSATSQKEKTETVNGEKNEKVLGKIFTKQFKLEGELPIMNFVCSLKMSSGTKVSGTMFISQNYICFSGSVFGSETITIISLVSIKDIKNRKKHIVINSAEADLAEPSENIFSQFEDQEEAFSLISSFWRRYQEQSSEPRKSEIIKKSKTSIELPLGSTKNKEGSDEVNLTSLTKVKLNYEPSSEDWLLILKGARTAVYQKGQKVVTQGDSMNRIYQLQRGECHFEKLVDGEVIILGKLNTESGDRIFGEITYLEGGQVTASVVCDKDGTEVSIIEGYWFNVLFQYHPELSGKWYHYLAHVLSKRLKQREAAANSASGLNAADIDKKKKKKKRIEIATPSLPTTIQPSTIQPSTTPPPSSPPSPTTNPPSPISSTPPN